MELEIDYGKEEARRYSKLIISYGVLLIGIIFIIGMLNITSIPAIDDFITPIVEAISLSPLWYSIGIAAQVIIETFWPFLLIYYGAHWVLKFEKKTEKPAKAK